MKTRKLTSKMTTALRAAARYGIVSGGSHASASLFHKLWEAGLIGGGQVASTTGKGERALKEGTYVWREEGKVSS